MKRVMTNANANADFNGTANSFTTESTTVEHMLGFFEIINT